MNIIISCVLSHVFPVITSRRLNRANSLLNMDWRRLLLSSSISWRERTEAMKNTATATITSTQKVKAATEFTTRVDIVIFFKAEAAWRSISLAACTSTPSLRRQNASTWRHIEVSQ